MFARFSREEGLWEPATLLLDLTSLLVIGGVAGRLDALPQRHWRFVAVVYGVMGLDEIDSSGGSMVSMPGGSTT